MRKYVPMIAVLVVVVQLVAAAIYPPSLWSLVIVLPLAAIATYDFYQTRHSILRNYPLLGHFRYGFEMLRPPFYQYFVESDTDGVPFPREERSTIYQRAKKSFDTIPFGTKLDVYEVGYEWANHSLAPTVVNESDMRVVVGNADCSQPYSASLMNISAMSFGALSKNAILALSKGAKIGGFAHNTGEGGISDYHLEGGGDLIWQIGTGYFGCRDEKGRFSADKFAAKSTHENVKMIEIKLSQGAKPGHGGILPASKLTPEIARIRDVPLGVDLISPPAHSAFNTPREFMQFVGELRRLSGGKPVGFKLCFGKPREFIAICKAMMDTGIKPDFIVVDGGEGGTGAAPMEFSNHIGTPMIEGLMYIHNALVGFDLRRDVRVFASGKVTSGFGLVKRLALGADACYSARGMMMALGCIQALRCNTNECPVGVATQNKHLVQGLVPANKANRVASFHHETLHSAKEIIGAMGIDHPADLRPWHILRRVSETQILRYSEVYPLLKPGDLLGDELPKTFARAIQAASPDTFQGVWDDETDTYQRAEE